MSTGYDEEYEVEIDSEEEEPSNLRKAARRGSKATRENELLKKKLAFYEAGIPMNDPKMKYFINGYDGEISADAIRMAALEAGFIGEPATQPEQNSSSNQEVFSAQQRVMDASRGAVITSNSEESAMAMLEQAMEEGGVEAMLEMAQQFGMQIGEVE
jgi:hypothetical protein